MSSSDRSTNYWLWEDSTNKERIVPENGRNEAPVAWHDHEEC